MVYYLRTSCTIARLSDWILCPSSFGSYETWLLLYIVCITINVYLLVFLTVLLLQLGARRAQPRE